MDNMVYASFALDIPILLALLGATTVALASRHWYMLKLILWPVLSVYLMMIGFTLLPRILNDLTLSGIYVYCSFVLALIAWLNIGILFLFTEITYQYRKLNLWLLNSFMTFLFWALSGGLYLGYLDVPDLLTEPVRSLFFTNGTPAWLIGPTFMWFSGTELWPVKVFFIAFAVILGLVYYKWRAPRLSILLMILAPIVVIFIPALHTDWVALIFFALYPVSLYTLGIKRLGYTFYGSFEKERGFFGNMENDTGGIPPRH